MNARTKITLARERVEDSEAYEKSKDLAVGIAKSVCEVAGYTAWRLGKWLRLKALKDVVKNDIKAYKDELTPKE